MQENITALLFDDIIINPYFICGHKFINLIMSAFREINIKSASDQAAIDNPDTKAVFQFLP